MLPCGEHAVLLELDGTPSALGVARALRLDPPDGVLEIVPAARTVLVRFDPTRTTAQALGPRLLAMRPVDPADDDTAAIIVPTVYDGADLDHVADLTGLHRDEVVRRHGAVTYTVAFIGFAPGFAYLTGGDPQLVVPRRSAPRSAVPAGAVALAGEYCGIYPRRSPGGWQLVGHTSLAVFDPAADPPTPFAPGTRVRFEARGPDA